MNTVNQKQKIRRHIVRHTILFVLLIMSCIVIYCSRNNLPTPVMEFCQRQIAKSGIVIEADDARLDVTRGIVLSRARAYRMGVIGPAFFETDETVLVMNPLFFLFRGFPVRKFILSGCQLRPEMLGQKAARKRVEMEQEMEFGVVLKNCSFRGVDIKHLDCNVRIVDGTVWIDNFEIVLLGEKKQHGFVRGRLVYNTQEDKLYGRCKTDIAPHLLIPLFEAYGAPGTANFFRNFEFSNYVPQCDIQFSVSVSEPQATKSSIQFMMRDSKYKNVDIRWATGTCKISHSDFGAEIAIERLQLWHNTGFAEVNFTNYPSMKTIRFSGTTELSPLVLLRLIGVLSESVSLRELNFSGETQIIADGIVDYGNYDNTVFKAKGRIAELVASKLHFKDLCFDMVMMGTTGVFSKVRADLCGGEVSGKAMFSFSKNNPSNMWYFLDCSVVDCSFEKLVNLFLKSPSSKYRGELSGRLKLDGNFGTDAIQKMTGNGKVSINNGYLFMLPLFGGLTELLSGIVPGVDFMLRQTDAKATFTIQDANIKFSEVNIAGDIFSFRGYGRYSFKDELDFSVQFTIMKEHTLLGKLIQIVSYPVSKFLEFRLRGTLATPYWSGFKLPSRVWKAIRTLGR